MTVEKGGNPLLLAPRWKMYWPCKEDYNPRDKNGGDANHSNKEMQMKTFTVSEQAKKGFPLKHAPEGAQDLLGVPIGQGILNVMREAQEAGHSETTWHWLDVVPDGNILRLIKEQNIRDKRALVLVDTCPGVGGSVKLFANTPREYLDEKKGRVMREARPFEEAVGVTLLAERVGPLGAPEFLVSMLPGSSFKIMRSGKLYDSSEKKNAPPEIVVLWNGRWDHRAEFDRFRNPPAERFAQFKKGQLRKSDFSKDDWDSLTYKDNPMKYWGLSVYSRGTRHGEV